MDRYPRFAVIEIHLQDTYQTPWGDARATFYNVWGDGIPWFAYDGLWDAWPIGTYESKLVARLAVPTPVTLRVGAVPLGGENYRIRIRSELEAGAQALNVRTYAVIVEDHYPANPTYERNDFRLATTTADFTLTPGSAHLETRDVTLNPGWIHSNLRIIAGAQAPLGAAPAEVYQAAQCAWPFPPLNLPGDMNCSGAVNFYDINPFVLALSNPDAYEEAFPDCPIENGDINQDGLVNFYDINPFVALLTGP